MDHSEEERDRKLYDDYLAKGLVNIKNLVLKNPAQRTNKENEFLIIFLNANGFQNAKSFTRSYYKCVLKILEAGWPAKQILILSPSSQPRFYVLPMVITEKLIFDFRIITCKMATGI